MSKKTKHVLVLITVNVFFVLVCFFVLVPVLYAFSVSLNAENSLLGSDFSFLPKHMTLQNYKAVFTEKPVLLWLKNSLILAVTTLVISLGTGIPAAYAFSRKRFSGRKAILKLLILLYAFPSLLSMTALYKLPELSATLEMRYEMNGAGQLSVTEKLTADPARKDIPDMFRFGMQLVMPEHFDRIVYYGRGPGENYADRKSSTFMGCYRQLVSEQFYPYVRPQETGSKSDVRWWKVTDADGRGVMFTSAKPFFATALHYLTGDLDDGEVKHQRHSGELHERDLTCVSLDGYQMGLGCVDSWGALPRPEYRRPYGDYSFTVVMTPVKQK